MESVLIVSNNSKIFVKNKKTAPTVGSKISEERMGKSIFYLTIKKVNNAEKPSNITKA